MRMCGRVCACGRVWTKRARCTARILCPILARLSPTCWGLAALLKARCLGAHMPSAPHPMPPMANDQEPLICPAPNPQYSPYAQQARAAHAPNTQELPTPLCTPTQAGTHPHPRQRTCPPLAPTSTAALDARKRHTQTIVNAQKKDSPGPTPCPSLRSRPHQRRTPAAPARTPPRARPRSAPPASSAGSCARPPPPTAHGAGARAHISSAQQHGVIRPGLSEQLRDHVLSHMWPA